MGDMLDPNPRQEAREMCAWVSGGGATDWNMEQYWVTAGSKTDLSVSKTSIDSHKKELYSWVARVTHTTD